jgi:hypothetical protein
VRLEPIDSTASAVELVLDATNANCAVGRDGRQHFYCITKDSSGFRVQNPNPRGTRRISGRLYATEIPRKRS